MINRCSKCQSYRMVELTHCIINRKGARWIYLCAPCTQKELLRRALAKSAPAPRPALNAVPLLLKRAREVQ